MPARRRIGFTLVELLVVIAIIGILIALLAPGRPSRPRSGSPLAVHQPPEATRPRCTTITTRFTFPPAGWADGNKLLDRDDPAVHRTETVVRHGELQSH